MKKIAYIELDTHAEIALNFYELTKGSHAFSVDYYFSQKILDQLGFQETESIFLANYKTIFQDLKNKGYDCVIIGTCHRYFNTFYRISKHFKTALIAHNTNFLHLGKRQLFINSFKEDFLYRLKLMFKEGLFLLPKIKNELDSVFVLDKVLADSNYSYLPIFYNPFEVRNKMDNTALTIVIAGSVSQQRRDYKYVLEKLKSSSRKIRVVFLGKAKGRELEWLQSFEKSKPKNIDLVYFTQKVKQSIFNQHMQSADFLWCPIQRETQFFSQKEIYGETKVSGNIGDAIKYGKIALFPEWFKTDLPFVIHEDSTSLDEQLDVVKNKKIDFQNDFSKGEISRKLELKLTKLLRN